MSLVYKWFPFLPQQWRPCLDFWERQGNTHSWKDNLQIARKFKQRETKQYFFIWLFIIVVRHGNILVLFKAYLRPNSNIALLPCENSTELSLIWHTCCTDWNLELMSNQMHVNNIIQYVHEYLNFNNFCWLKYGSFNTRSMQRN